MIVPNMSAQMRCDEAGCDAKTHVELVLLVHGGFGFRPLNSAAEEWQVGTDGQGYVTFCKKHRQETQRIVTASAVSRATEAALKRGH